MTPSSISELARQDAHIDVDLEKTFQPPAGAAVYQDNGKRFVQLKGGQTLQVWPAPEDFHVSAALLSWANDVFFWFSSAEYDATLAEYNRLERLEKAARRHGSQSTDPAANLMYEWRELPDAAGILDMAELIVRHLAGFSSRGWAAIVAQAIREHGHTDVRDCAIDIIREGKAPKPATINLLKQRCELLREVQ